MAYLVPRSASTPHRDPIFNCYKHYRLLGRPECAEGRIVGLCSPARYFRHRPRIRYPHSAVNLTYQNARYPVHDGPMAKFALVSEPISPQVLSLRYYDFWCSLESFIYSLRSATALPYISVRSQLISKPALWQL